MELVVIELIKRYIYERAEEENREIVIFVSSYDIQEHLEILGYIEISVDQIEKELLKLDSQINLSFYEVEPNGVSVSKYQQILPK